MKQYALYLFDLDGTLTDSQIGLENAILYAALKTKNITVSKEVLGEFLGPPLEIAFPSYLGFNDHETETAIKYFKTYYIANGLLGDNFLYHGVDTLLSTLKNQGKKIALATSKPLDQGKKVLEHFNLIRYFDFLGGASNDGSLSDKADIINLVVNAFPAINKRDMLMIGDRKYDLIGARKNSIDSAGVQYGYAKKGELEIENPTYLIESVKKFIELID